jgi:hypothetical protein
MRKLLAPVMKIVYRDTFNNLRKTVAIKLREVWLHRKDLDTMRNNQSMFHLFLFILGGEGPIYT